MKKKSIDIESLFYEYRDKGYAFFLKTLNNPEVAKDMIQEVFLKILEKENINDIEHWNTYFYTICRNLAYDYFRKAKRELRYKESLFDYWNQKSKINNISIENEIDIKKKINTLNKHLKSLSYQQRLILYLNKTKNLSIKEIADELNLSPYTVRNHLHRALKKIRLSKFNLLLIGMYNLAWTQGLIGTIH